MTSIKQFYLLKLIEECSEVAQQAAKQMQFGHYAISPSTGKVYDNTNMLRFEVNDLLAVLDVLIDLEELPEISPEELLKAKNKKRNRIMEYLQHSQELGLVEKDFKDYGVVKVETCRVIPCSYCNGTGAKCKIKSNGEIEYTA